MSRAEKMARKMADEKIRLSPQIAKSAGTREQLAREYLPVATAIVDGIKPFEKAAKKILASQGKRLEDMSGKLRQGDGRWNGWHPTEQGFTDFTPEKFTLAPDKPVKVNGHGDTRGTPLWHPEHPVNQN
jgi:hypothetical protein